MDRHEHRDLYVKDTKVGSITLDTLQLRLKDRENIYQELKAVGLEFMPESQIKEMQEGYKRMGGSF